MNKRGCFFTLAVLLCVLPGCVTSRYTDGKGRECTRRYFTPLGIPAHSCKEPAQSAAPAAVPAEPQGAELKVELLAPAPPLRQTTPAKAIEQNIRSSAQAVR